MACKLHWNRPLKHVVFATILVAGCSAGAQSKSKHPLVFDLPRGRVSRISSPDHRWTLILECPDYGRERKLWIEDNTHIRRFVRDFERSLAISWAPDSHFFFVEDAYASNETLSYVFDPVTLKVIDLAKLLRAADPESDNFVQVGHSYLRAKYWLNSHELLVTLDGYYDDPPPREYSLKYRVNINGKAQKIYQHLAGDWK